MGRFILATTGTSAGGPPFAKPDKPYSVRAAERWESLIAEKPRPLALQQFSAETNSLQSLKLSSEDAICLLATDTEMGRACAEFLENFIHREFGTPTEVVTITGLQVEDAVRFRREGVQNLFREMDARVGQRRFDPSSETILNPTGGFKSVVPYVTLYGLLRRFRVIYIFERSDQLITLPPVPLGFDQDLVARAEAALSALKREGVLARDAVERLIKDFTPMERPLFEGLWESDRESDVTLSAFGELLAQDQEVASKPVLLSAAASKTYEKAAGTNLEALNLMLKHMRDPSWIRRNSKSFGGSDLVDVKAGNVGYRAAGFWRGQQFHVCFLFAKHDDYERILHGKFRKDLENQEFTAWVQPPAGVPDSEEQLFASLKSNLERTRERLEEVQAAYSNLRGKMSDHERILKRTEKDLSTSLNKESSLSADLATARKSLDEERQHSAALRKKIEDLRDAFIHAGFWQRIRRAMWPSP